MSDDDPGRGKVALERVRRGSMEERDVRRSKLVVILLAVAVAAGAGAWVLTQNESPVEARAGEWAGDGSARFKVGVVRCGERFVQESPPFCLASLVVENTSAEAIEISDLWQKLHFDSATFESSNDSEAFESYAGRFFTSRHAFAVALEPGRQVPGEILYFGVPVGELPNSLELHATSDSRGILVDVTSVSGLE